MWIQIALLVVVSLVALAYFGLMAIVVYVVSAMSRMRMDVLEHEDLELAYQKALEIGLTQDWLEANDFVSVGAYRMDASIISATVLAWVHATDPRYICVYLIQDQVSIDIATEFDGERRSLTTATSLDGTMLPRHDESWMQALPDQPVDVLYDAHIAAESALVDQLRYRSTGGPVSFEESFMESARRQLAFVKQIPLWPLRAPIWYLTRKSRGRATVVEQISKRLARASFD